MYMTVPLHYDWNMIIKKLEDKTNIGKIMTGLLPGLDVGD